MAPLARAVLVVGMHRSGTSAMTRMLNLIGGALPRKLEPGSGANEPGVWEGRRIVREHEALLASLDSSWDDVRELPEGWLDPESTRTHEDALLGLLHADFSEAPVFVVTDPRVSRLVPLWLRLLGAFDPSRASCQVRHPVEVAWSLATRSGLAEAKSLRLWLIHEAEAERYSRGFPRVFVTYDRLLNDPAAVVARVGDPSGWVSCRRRRRDPQLPLGRVPPPCRGGGLLRDGTDLREWVQEAYELARRAADDETFGLDGSAAAAFDELGRRMRAPYRGVASSS